MARFLLFLHVYSILSGVASLDLVQLLKIVVVAMYEISCFQSFPICIVNNIPIYYAIVMVHTSIIVYRMRIECG